jgi:hypothetical protein
VVLAHPDLVVTESIGRMASMVQAGVVVVALLALNDDGSPAYEHSVAAALAAVGVTAFACTPDLFPDLMAADQGVTTAAPVGTHGFPET